MCSKRVARHPPPLTGRHRAALGDRPNHRRSIAGADRVRRREPLGRRSPDRRTRCRRPDNSTIKNKRLFPQNQIIHGRTTSLASLPRTTPNFHDFGPWPGREREGRRWRATNGCSSLYNTRRYSLARPTVTRRMTERRRTRDLYKLMYVTYGPIRGTDYRCHPR